MLCLGSWRQSFLYDLDPSPSELVLVGPQLHHLQPVVVFMLGGYHKAVGQQGLDHVVDVGFYVGGTFVT